MTMFKHYIPKAILLTVRFTGTHFTRSLLSHLGDVYIPSAHWLDQEVTDEWEKIKLRKVIVTVRDPRLSAIRAIKTRADNAVEDIANEWNTMIGSLDQLDHFVFNIEHDNRLEHAYGLFDFIGIKPMRKIEQFVDRWAPQNVSKSEAKIKYLESGEPPEGHNWDSLQPAIDWYNQLTTRI